MKEQERELVAMGFCENDDTIPGITLDLTFSAQSDGTVSGTYTIFAPGAVDIEGVITDGTTDGTTYSLTGEGQVYALILL